MASTKKICDTCLRFPWHNLPAEDASGQQHHATRKLLEESAQQCPVCNFVLRAAVANYQDSRGTRNGKGYWRQHNCIHYKDASGIHQMNVVKELGACLPAGQTTPSNNSSRTIVSCVPVQEVGAMAPGYRSGQTILVPTGSIDSDFSVGVAQPDQGQGRDLQAETATLPVWVYGNWWCHRDIRKAGLHPHLMGVGARFGRTASPWDAVNTSPGKVHLRGSNIRLRTNDGSSFEHIPGRIIEKDSSSPTAFKRLKAWVDACVSGHSLCAGPSGDPTLPMRVLDLGVSRSFVRLVEFNGQRAKYATLSHSWSKATSLTTTRSNFEEHKRGIIMLDLPPTFCDAINVAKQLGLQYLWIDCLCIVQDDVQERESENAKMGQVYRNAHITISAAHGEDSYDGCFPLRSQQPVASPASRSMGYATAPGSESHSIGFLTGQGAPSLVHLSEDWLPGSSGALPQFSNIGAFGQDWDPISEEPLSTRGRALQERLLSRRIIHYTSSQMYFECQCGLQSEDGFHVPNTRFSIQRMVQANKNPTAGQGVPGTSEPSFVRGGPPRRGQGPRMKGGWLSLVEDFSRRALEDPSEKLTAIAGAARVLAEHTEDEYLAGLWHSHILEDLFWHTEDPSHGADRVMKNSGEVQAGVVPQYRAPSWSWAALDSAVRFDTLDHQGTLAQVVKCKTRPSGVDPFGAVSDGELELMGPLFELTSGGPSSSNNKHATAVSLVKTSDDYSQRKYTGLFFSDTPVGADCFPCYAMFLDPLRALVIRPQNTSGKQRQGLTTELVRDRTETELPNWGWRCEGSMVRVGIAEFNPDAVGDEPAVHGGDWSEDVGSLTLNEPGQGRQTRGPANRDDARICVLIK